MRIYNQATGQQVVLVAVPADPGVGGLAPNASLARSVTVTLPDIIAASGTLVITVISDRDVNNNTQITQADANAHGIEKFWVRWMLVLTSSCQSSAIERRLSTPPSDAPGAR